ncbi:hypothetical protein EK21DRAFT_96206 [Setomelanomma holmii]|uniref:DUF1996 domain-containing protein n=1 Tax=Setomelanomma holmii TaxID=210430 RepID=A0A9P4LSC3_9PLEO|nr:hypothetical protein EK21DRAFT_96206 [Setomelanomma holmii]
MLQPFLTTLTLSHSLTLLPAARALIRLGCSQLVIDRLDPLLEAGSTPSAHLHQIIGGNSFVPDMRPKKRVPQKGNVGFEEVNGGKTVYYMQNQLAGFQQKSKAKAFQPISLGFRMLIGSPTLTTRAEADKFPQLTCTCLQDMGTRFPETKYLPTKPCPAGIMVNLRFPICWDGVNLDSLDYISHMSYPASGTFESQGPCPSSHPVRMPQRMFEVIYKTPSFKDSADWPEDGSQPFVHSFGDATGFANHGDYLFGWKYDSLQQIMDEECYVGCSSMRTQSVKEMNECSVTRKVDEDVGISTYVSRLGSWFRCNS